MAAKNQTSTITLGLKDLFSNGLGKAGAAATGFTRHLDGLNQRMAAVSGRLNAVGSSFATSFSLPAAFAFSAATQGAANAENAMIDVERAFGDGAVSMRQMQEQAARLGLTIADLGNRLADVGFAGIESPTEALKFVDLARKSAVAFNAPLEQINENMMQIRSGYGLTFGGVQQALEGMNIAADASSAKVSDIADATQRLASYGRLLKISAADMAAFSAAGVSAGLSPERMATGLNAYLRTLTAGTSATKKARSAFRELGLEAEEVQHRMNLDPRGTLEDVLERINSIGDASKKISLLNDLVGADNADEVAVIAGQLKEIERIQGEIAAKSSGSIDREFEKRAGSLSNSLSRLGASFKNLGVGVGSVFAPEIAKFAGLFENLNVKLAQNPGAVRAMASALVAVAAAGPGLLFAGKALGTFSALGSVAAFALRPLALLGQTLTASASALATFGIKGGKAAASSAARLATRLAALGVAGVAVAGAAALVYASWKPLSKAFADFAKNPALGSALTNAGEALNKLLDADWAGFALHAGIAMRAAGRAIAALVQNVIASLMPAWDSATERLDERFPSFKRFRESVSALYRSLKGALSEIWLLMTNRDAQEGKKSLREFADQLGELGFGAVTQGLNAMASGIERLSAGLKGFREARESGLGFGESVAELYAAAPVFAKLAYVGAAAFGMSRGLGVLAGNVTRLTAAMLASRASFATLTAMLMKLPVLRIGAAAAALTEFGKWLGIIDEKTNSFEVAINAIAAAFAVKQIVSMTNAVMGLSAALSGAWAAASGSKAAARAGALAVGAYNLAIKVGAAVASIIAAAWSALKTGAARVAGAIAGAAYAAGVKIGEKLTSAVSGAWSSLKTDGIASAKGAAMGRAMGIAFKGAFYGAGILAALDLVNQIPTDKDELKRFMDDNRRRTVGFSDRLDDATGFSDLRNWLRGLGGFEPLKRNGKPYEFQGPQFPAGLKSANDNLQTAAKAVTVQAPVVNIARVPVSSQIPGEGMTGGRFPGKHRDDLDLGLLRMSTDRTASGVEALRGEMKAELSGVRAGIESTNSRLDSINSGISQIPPAIRAGLTWAGQAAANGATPSGKTQVNSNGLSGVRRG